VVSKSAKCACFLVLQGIGGHANDGGNTTGGHTAAAVKSVKCACFLVVQGVGGHSHDGGDTTGGHTAAVQEAACRKGNLLSPSRTSLKGMRAQCLSKELRTRLQKAACRKGNLLSSFTVPYIFEGDESPLSKQKT
jgi:hypothetical protein